MSDFPKFVQINEEGPREGFQFETGKIPTARKIELIDALSETGVSHIQVASFVNPNRVPGWADADAVVRGFKRHPGVHYSPLWLNAKGFQRALGFDGAGNPRLAVVMRLGKISRSQPAALDGGKPHRAAGNDRRVRGERRAGRARIGLWRRSAAISRAISRMRPCWR